MWLIQNTYISFSANTEVAPTLPLKCTLVYYDSYSSKKGNKTINSDILKETTKILGALSKDTPESEIQAEIRFISISNPNISEEHYVILHQNDASSGKDKCVRLIHRSLLKPYWTLEYTFNGEWHVYDENGLNVIGDSGSFDTVRIDEQPTITYLGYARPATTDEQALWKIKRIDSTTNPIKIEWAEGNQNYNKIWTDRETYTYL